MSELYLLHFSCTPMVGNLTWQQLHSMNCMIFDGVGVMGFSYHWGHLGHIKMPNLSPTMDMRGVMVHEYFSGHYGMVIS